MYIARFILAIGLSVSTLGISFILDRLFHRIPYHVQFFLQIPIIIIIIDNMRLYFLAHAPQYNLTEAEINGSFFFVAPMVSIGSATLFAEIRRTLPLIKLPF